MGHSRFPITASASLALVASVAASLAVASPSPRTIEGADPAAAPDGAIPAPPEKVRIAPEDGGDPTPPAFSFDGTYVAPWTAQAARSISLGPDTTIPYMIEPTDAFDPGIYVWDAWPVRTPDGAIAVIDGWSVLVALTAEQDPDARFPFYSRSTWRYYYTNGDRWLPGGVIFDRTEALGSRQWAGSTMYDPDSGSITFFYTAVGSLNAPNLEEDVPDRAFADGHPAAGRPDTTQRMAQVSATVSAGPSGVAFADFGPHEMILEADGEIYATSEAFVPNNVIYGMRDPEYWRDPQSGVEYILFTANAAGFPSPYNGAVGVARREGADWRLQRPILVAPGVSSQLERPHIVARDDGLYLFFSTHAFTFADELSGPEGLYGFWSPSGDLRGAWQPINGHGLVAGNPPASPTQAYSYLALPDGHVMSYVNTPYGFKADPAEDRVMVGGPAPMFRIALKEGKSTIVSSPTPTTGVE